MAEPDFASRAGLKLAAAMDAFGVDVAGTVCADLGCHAGGFVDCLLQQGAGRVHAVDPGYGIFDFKLRRDPRVALFTRAFDEHAKQWEFGLRGTAIATPWIIARWCRTGRSNPPPFQLTSWGVNFSMPSKKRRIRSASDSPGSPTDQTRRSSPRRNAHAIATTLCR